MLNKIIDTNNLVEIEPQELISIYGGGWWADLKAGFVSAFSSMWDNLVTYLTVE